MNCSAPRLDRIPAEAFGPELVYRPTGHRARIEQITELMQRSDDGDDDASFNGMHWMAARPEFRRRYFVVWFRNAAVRAVFPADANPQEFTHQIVTNPDERADILRISLEVVSKRLTRDGEQAFRAIVWQPLW